MAYPVLRKTDLEALDELLPHRCPDPKMTPAEIWVYAGQRKLVDRLILEYRQAQKS